MNISHTTQSVNMSYQDESDDIIIEKRIEEHMSIRISLYLLQPLMDLVSDGTITDDDLIEQLKKYE